MVRQHSVEKRPEEIFARIAFDPRKLFAGATHSHTAPEIMENHSPDPGKPIMDIFSSIY